MKRKIICVALLALAIICCISGVACATTQEPIKLETPSNVEIWGREISWDKVEKADGYTVKLNGKETDVTENKCRLPDSVKAGEYTIEIMAFGYYRDTQDSDRCEFEFTLYDPLERGYDEQGFHYRLRKDGESYEIDRGNIDEESELLVDLVLPDKYLNYPVKEIESSGFEFDFTHYSERDVITGEWTNKNTKTLKLPSRLEIIGAYAFEYYINLKEVIFPETLVEVESCAFLYCVRLQNVEFNEGLKKIGMGAFSSCAIQELNLPQSLEYIGALAFEGTNHRSDEYKLFVHNPFTSVTIPENVSYIGDKAFVNCSRLNEINIMSDNIEYIGERIAHEKHYETSVGEYWTGTAWVENQPEGFVFLRDDILYGYKGTLPEDGVLEIPKGVKYIANGAFRDQMWIEAIIPEGVEKIPDDAFNFCWKMTKVTLPESLISIGKRVFYDCGFEEIIIPAGVVEIGNEAFSKTLLKEVTIPEGVTQLSSSVLNSCSKLTVINLPQSITELGTHSLDCSSLETINFAGTKGEWEEIQKESKWLSYKTVTVHCADATFTVNGSQWPDWIGPIY